MLSVSRLRNPNPSFNHLLHRFQLCTYKHRFFPHSTILATNRHLRDLFRSGHHDDARKLFDEMPERDVFSWNTMVTGYASMGMLREARSVFCETPCKSSITWNALISGYCKHGCENEAVGLVREMLVDNGVKPTEFTLGSVLGMCSKKGLVGLGEQVHCFAVKCRLDFEVSVVAGLVDMYAKRGFVDEAEYVFGAANCKESCVVWTALLTGYLHCGYGHSVMEGFRNMLVEGIEPNEFTFPVILTACAAVLAVFFGRLVQSYIVKFGFGDNVFVVSALVDMYAKCGDLDSAKSVLHNAETENSVSWNSMIVGCAREGLHGEALSLFKEMHGKNMRPDEFTYPSVLNCFTSCVDTGETVHCLLIKSGFEDYRLVGNCLIDMYSKQHDIGGALKVFGASENKDEVSWTSLITGYMLNGMHEEALRLFGDMRTRGIPIDEYSASAILSTSAELTTCEFGKQLHAFSIKTGLESCLSVSNSLINMYVKSGCVSDAMKIFDRMDVRELVAWTSLIVGCAQNGQAEYSVKLYEEMVASGVVPDSVTFIGLLFACSHAGFVEVGESYFEAMSKVYEIEPGIEHFSCMIDLLARNGKLGNAEILLNMMPMNPGATIWKSLLAGCRIQRNVDLAEKAAHKLFELEPSNAVPYVSLANIYSAVGRWEDAANIRKKMNSKLISKEPGYSWMEANGSVHTFTSEERNHPKTAEIYLKVDEMIVSIKKAGYVPEISAALHDVDDEGKERSLAYHSEKLAVAFGLLASPPGAPIRVFKNIRVCIDCHAAMKCISQVYDRHIVLRDSNCFHHFKQGVCSCKDYW